MIRPLEYNSGLSLKEAEERYREIRDEFEEVKFHYSGLFGRLIRPFGLKDSKTLGDCIGVLLPLCLERSVQEQLLQRQPTLPIEETVWYKAGQLQFQIFHYLANFKNTGVTRLQGSLE